MKKLLLLLVLPLILAGCSSSLDNSLTLKNISAGAIYLNFKGEIITVESGKTVVVKDIPKGTYTYATTYEIPAAASTATFVGAATGSLSFKPGTKVTILYSSVLSGTTYTLYATMSTSDDQTTKSGTNPVGQ